MSKKKETLFKQRCQRDIKDIQKQGGKLWCVKTQMVSVRGIPDFILCVSGDFWAVELKKDEFEEPDPLQSYRLDAIKAAGGRSFKISPKDWPEFRTMLQRAAWGR